MAVAEERRVIHIRTAYSLMPFIHKTEACISMYNLNRRQWSRFKSNNQFSNGLFSHPILSACKIDTLWTEIVFFFHCSSIVMLVNTDDTGMIFQPMFLNVWTTTINDLYISQLHDKIYSIFLFLFCPTTSRSPRNWLASWPGLVKAKHRKMIHLGICVMEHKASALSAHSVRIHYSFSKESRAYHMRKFMFRLWFNSKHQIPLRQQTNIPNFY